LSNYGAGILTAGNALAGRISARIYNEQATPPAAKRTSQNAQVIFSPCLTLRRRTGASETPPPTVVNMQQFGAAVNTGMKRTPPLPNKSVFHPCFIRG